MRSELIQYKVGDLVIEVNWNEYVKPAEKFRFTMGGKSQIVDRSDVYALLFLFGDEDQQTDLIPVKETPVVPITRLLKIVLQKDMRKGDTLAFRYTYFVPTATYERIRLSPDVKKASEKSLMEKNIIEKQATKSLIN